MLLATLLLQGGGSVGCVWAVPQVLLSETCAWKGGGTCKIMGGGLRQKHATIGGYHPRNVTPKVHVIHLQDTYFLVVMATSITSSCRMLLRVRKFTGYK